MLLTIEKMYCYSMPTLVIQPPNRDGFAGLLRDTKMEKQAINMTDFGANFGGYYESHKIIEGAKGKREECRKFLEPVIRAHKIPVGDNKAWKALQPIFSQEFLWLEGPRDADGLSVPHEDLTAVEVRQLKARVAAWLGVVRTCLEYQILPTDKNADRLRKARMWTALSGNGKPNPNWVDPNAPKIEAKPVEAAPVQTVSAPIIQKIEAMQANVDAVFGTARPTTQTQTITQPQTPTKVPSISPTTPQKTETKVVPLHANISGDSEAPISSREHCGILLDQLFKNEAFRSEFAPILAMCLDSNVATVTRCLVEARDAMLNGKGAK